MTAVAIYRHAEEICIGSDGATYNPEGGAMMGITSKVSLIPEWSCVLAQRGAGGVLAAVRFRLGFEIQGFDDVLDRIPEVCREVYHEYIDRGYPWPKFSVFICGWSEARGRMETYILRSQDKDVPVYGGGTVHMAAFTLVPLPAFYAAPYPDEALQERFGIGEHAPMTSVDYVTRAICAARHQGHDPDEPPFYSVGGFVQVTVLRRNEVQSWIAHQWPDEIGVPIDPGAGEPLPAYLTAPPAEAPV